jgi:hypothetical protein
MEGNNIGHRTHLQCLQDSSKDSREQLVKVCARATEMLADYQFPRTTICGNATGSIGGRCLPFELGSYEIL